MAGVRQSLRHYAAQHPEQPGEPGLYRLLDNLQSVIYQLTQLGSADADAEFPHNVDSIRFWFHGRTEDDHINLDLDNAIGQGVFAANR